MNPIFQYHVKSFQKVFYHELHLSILTFALKSFSYLHRFLFFTLKVYETMYNYFCNSNCFFAAYFIEIKRLDLIFYLYKRSFRNMNVWTVWSNLWCLMCIYMHNCKGTTTISIKDIMLVFFQIHNGYPCPHRERSPVGSWMIY